MQDFLTNERRFCITVGATPAECSCCGPAKGTCASAATRIHLQKHACMLPVCFEKSYISSQLLHARCVHSHTSHYECDAVPCCAAGQSVRHHMLTNYMHAILSVVLAQYTGLGFLDGMEGVIKLAEASPYMQVNAMARVCLQAWPGMHACNCLCMRNVFWMYYTHATQLSCSTVLHT